VNHPPASKSPPPPPPPPKAPAKPVFKPSQQSGSPILRFGADDASPSNADSKPTPGPIYYKDLPSDSSADQEELEDEPIYSPPSPLSAGGFPEIDEDTFPSAVENTVSQFVEPVGTDDVGEISPFSYFSRGRDAINIVDPPQVFYGRYTSGEDKTTPPPPRPTVDTSSHSRYPEVSDTYRLYPNYPPLEEGHPTPTPAAEEDSAFPYAFLEEETQSEPHSSEITISAEEKEEAIESAEKKIQVKKSSPIYYDIEDLDYSVFEGVWDPEVDDPTHLQPLGRLQDPESGQKLQQLQGAFVNTIKRKDLDQLPLQLAGSREYTETPSSYHQTLPDTNYNHFSSPSNTNSPPQTHASSNHLGNGITNNYPYNDFLQSESSLTLSHATNSLLLENEFKAQGSESEHLQSERDLTDEVDSDAEFDEVLDGDKDVDTLQEIKNALDANSGGHPLFAPDRPKDAKKEKESNINYLPEKKQEKLTTKKTTTVTEKPAIESTIATTEGAKYTYKTYKDQPIATTKVPPQASGNKVVKEEKHGYTTDTGLFVSPKNQLGKNFPSQKNFQIPDDIRDAEIKPPSWINMENW